MSNLSRRSFAAGTLATVGALLLSGCGFAKKVHAPKYTTKTKVYYSPGDDNDWAYVDQQKEFDANTDCYVRIMSMVYEDNITAAKGDEISVKYIFKGTDVADVIFTDGAPLNVEQTDDENEVVYSYTATAKKKGSDTEEYFIFKYVPLKEGSITLNIEYGEEVPESDDWQSTIYFIGETQRETTKQPNADLDDD